MKKPLHEIVRRTRGRGTTTSRILMNDQGSVFGSDAATVNGTSFANVDARAVNDAIFETRRIA